ncbi:hypothetical protein, partial [Streptomyces sp. T028]|uniref:hypothetical protein n=1 Tax=Streptomyces sp. T028 TaxID=3394379 RepID=UPI003A8C76A6
MYRGDPDNAASVRARRRRAGGTFETRPRAWLPAVARRGSCFTEVARVSRPVAADWSFRHGASGPRFTGAGAQPVGGEDERRAVARERLPTSLRA